MEREKVTRLFGSTGDIVRIHQEIQPVDGYEEDD
jgi:hypothetical protein